MYEILFLFFLIFFGLITSLEDYLKGKIRNKWVLIALAYGIIINIIIGFKENSYFSLFFLNLIFTFITGLIIWAVGLWSAGDSKLFLAFSALIPLTAYTHSSISFFPSFNLLINTFVPIFIYYFFIIFIKTSSKQKINVIKEMLSPKIILNISLFLFSFGWLITKILKLSKIEPNMFIVLTILFILIFLLERFIKISLLIISFGILILSLALDFSNIYNLQYLYFFIETLALFLFLRYFILNLSYYALSYPIYIEKLKEGMIIAENITSVGEKIKKAKSIPISFLQYLLETANSQSILGSIGDGLSKKDILKIINLHNNGKIKDHTIRIYQTIAFAPFILLGALLTIICQGNAMVYLFLKLG